MKTQNEQSHAGKRKGCLRWGLIAMGGVFALCMFLFLAAFTVEKIILAQLPIKYPAPGRMVDAGEYSLHLYCTGDPSAMPLVVVSMVTLACRGCWSTLYWRGRRSGADQNSSSPEFSNRISSRSMLLPAARFEVIRSRFDRT